MARKAPSQSSLPHLVSQLEQATVVQRGGGADGAVVVETRDESEIAASESDLIPFDYQDALAGLSDLSLLSHASPAAVLYAVYQRFQCNCHYTFAGDMLVAINPYQWLRYAPSVPHPVRIAERAFRLLTTSDETESDDVGPLSGGAAVSRTTTVLITGLSGAGKTEAAKMVMRYLADRCTSLGEAAGPASSSSSAHPPQLLNLLRAVDPILELFGNAPTCMNENSSRFAKCISLDVDIEKKCIVGVTVGSFLLEASRLVDRNADEGTFHVMHALFQPSKKLRLDLKKELDLWDASQFRCLRVGGSTSSVRVATRLPYTLDDLLAAFEGLGMGSDAAEDVLRVLAGILHLLNIEFTSDDAYSAARVLDRRPVETAARLLGLADVPPSFQVSQRSSATTAGLDSSPFLERVLTSVQLGNDVKSLHRAAAVATRDSLAKMIYESLFSFLLGKLSYRDGGSAASSFEGGERAARDPPPRSGSSKVRTLQLLDIFGFEQVHPPAKNDLEQLLINYTNEMLQGVYDETTTTAYITQTEREGVQGAIQDVLGGASGGASVVDNKCLEVLTKKPNGVLNVISDDSTLAQQSSSQAAMLADKILTLQRVYPDVVKRNKVNPTAFQLAHYCDVVEYSTEAMGIKNRLSGGVGYVLRTSTNPLIRACHSTMAVTASHKTPTSQIALFREQLDRLQADLRQSNLCWIRCVKPNNSRSPTEFDGAFVASQLSSSGVFRALKLQSEGYAVVLPHAVFARQYLLPFFSTAAATTKPASEQFFAHYGAAKYQAACQWATKTVPACQNRKLFVGVSKVFTKAQHLSMLTKVAQSWKDNATKVLARVGRGFLGRAVVASRRFEKLKTQRLAQVLKRIEGEVPIRQALELERAQLHQGLRGAAKSLCQSFSRHAQKKVGKLFHAVQDHVTSISSDLQRTTAEILHQDEVRVAKERKEKDRYAILAASSLAAQAQLEEEKAKRAASAQARNLTRHKEEARAAERERQRLVSAEDERRLAREQAELRKTQLRTEEELRLRRLQRSQTQYEQSMVAEAQRHLLKQHQRVVRVQEEQIKRRSDIIPMLSAPRVRDAVSSSVVRSVGRRQGDDDDFSVQRDLWRLWEQSRQSI